MHFIFSEESEKRELKGYNIIGYVSDIYIYIVWKSYIFVLKLELLQIGGS